MRFHVLLPVRDEADIISQSLAHMLTWADTISVFDSGSVDSTWEIVQDFAARDKRVLAMKKDAVFYSENRLRGWLFHQARQYMRTGDWFLRVDADEFHHIPPPKFVTTRLAPHETIVYHQYYDFRLPQSEVDDWETGRETVSDRVRPISERRRWFTPSIYSEPRLCRYRESMQWPPTVSFPFNAGYTARERIPIRHYPHRDPEQLRGRCILRAFMIALNSTQLFTGYNRNDVQGLVDFVNELDETKIESEWRKFVVPDNLEELQFWRQDTPLPDFKFSNHLQPPHIRLMQRVVHRYLLNFLDSKRNRWNENDYPSRIPSEVVLRLNSELQKKAYDTSHT